MTSFTPAVHSLLLVAPASPTSSVEEVYGFLTALVAHPGAPRVCRKQIVYIDDQQRVNWKHEEWPDHAEFGTYAFTNHGGGSSHATHRLVYFNRPARGWTGKAGRSWDVLKWAHLASVLGLQWEII